MFHVKHSGAGPGKSLEPGLPAGHTVATGKRIWTKLGLAQNFVAELVMDERNGREPELGQRTRWPTGSLVLGDFFCIGAVGERGLDLFSWRLRNDQPSSLTKEWCCTFGHNCWHAE